MPIRPFKSLDTTNAADLNRIQTNIGMFSSGIVGIPILDGNLIEDVVLGSTETKVNHKLGRRYRGWVIVDKSANQSVWAATSAISERYLSLTASGTVTVSLWVF